MDRRCAAGALLALAACIASSAAAPTASNQTALDTYDGASEGCYYNFQHYGEGDRIMTNEPCLNCTCHNRMLMCYLRVCPFTKPIGQDCSVEKRADQCCPIVTCPDVPVDLLTSTSTTSPAEYGETGLGKLDRYGCSINGKYFPEGSKVPPTPNKPCEHCYCIRNMTTCVMQECTLHVDGCTPIYHKDVCCPVRYSCDHPEDEIPLLDDMTTTVRPTPGFLLTTTTLSPVTQMTQDCVHDDKIFADGALIKTEKACEHCYCMKGDIVCVVQECGTPMENEGKNCTSMPPREGQCCPDTYICEGDESTTESKSDFTTTSSLEDFTTLSPPRRVIEGSGYRNEPDEPFTEVPTYEPDTEGSGEEQEPFKPIDDGEMLIPEKVITPPYVVNEQDETTDKISLSTTEIPTMDTKTTEKTTTEPDKGENTVPSESIDDDSSKTSIKDKTRPEEDTTVTQSVPTTESYFDGETTAGHVDDSKKDEVTSGAEAMATEPAPITETTIVDSYSPSSPDKAEPAEAESITTAKPIRTEQDDEVNKSTMLNEMEESSTKAGDFIAPDSITTESTTTIVQQESKATTAQVPVQENEVLVKEITTESTLKLSTESHVITTETEPTTTKQPDIVTELSTPGKDHSIDTTSINPVDNEIDEESYPTSSPGRIPGEGDCLLDGVTYSNDSIVPSSNNCHTGCRCVSSIVKCDPIICSAPPDYMDNCQPMYDPPESCCPTYVCDHTKETVPPQPHSQMSGTESPVSTPATECDGDQCQITKDKQDSLKPTEPCNSESCSHDSSKKPEECGTEGCQEPDRKPDHDSHPLGPADECIGENCNLPQELCVEGKCESPIKKDQTCDSENGCEIPIAQPCQSEDCKIQSETSPSKDSTPCDNPDTCKDSKIPETVPDCEGELCISGLPSKSAPKETEECKDGSNCAQPDESPAIEECKEESCKKQQVSDISKPVTGESPSKDSTPPCDNPDTCKDSKIPETVPDCEGELCISGLPSKSAPKETEECKDGSNCAQPDESPATEECKEESCKKQQVPDISKPVTGESPSKDSTPPCDNPDTCKDSKIPETVPDCEGELCTSGLPSKSAPKETEECKDGSNCAQPDESPATEECKEESCKKQQVPDISKPVIGECTDSECVSQDKISHITDAPNLNTESETQATISPVSNDIKTEEPFTSQPKTTIMEKGTEPSQTTETSILIKNEEPESTTQYDEGYPQKEKEHQSSITTPEMETQSPEGQKLDSSTETTIQKETTTSQLEDETKKPELHLDSTLSEETSTSSPISEKDDRTTELPESVTKSDQMLVDERRSEAPSTQPQEEMNIYEGLDATTTMPFVPIIQDESTKIEQETTESKEIQTTPEYSNMDKQEPIANEPEYVRDQDELNNETPNLVAGNEKPEDKETDAYTRAPEQFNTDKNDEELITAQYAPTTPKSYDDETNAPDILDTKSPMEKVTEDNLDVNTVAPEKLSTLSQEKDDDKQITESSVSVTSDAPITTRLDDMSLVTEGISVPDTKAAEVTKSPTSEITDVTSKPQISLNEEVSTRFPESTADLDVELSTKAPVQDVTQEPTDTKQPDEQVTEGQEIITKMPEIIDKDQDQQTGDQIAVKTESPMSIVKEHGEDEINTTQKSETDMVTNEQELSTKKPESTESPMPYPTKSEPEQEPSAKPDKAVTEKEIEKLPSLSDEEHIDVVTAKADTNIETTIRPVVRDDSSTELSVKEVDETTMPALIANTDETPISVSIVEEPITSEHDKPAVTKNDTQKPDKETSEIVPSEGMDTNAPESFTEIPMQTSPEDKDIISPVTDQFDEKINTITEIPELTVHEHTEGSLTTEKQSQFVTEKDASEVPNTLFTNPPETTSQNEVTETPKLESAKTNAPEFSVTDASEAPMQEFVTKTPEHPQTAQSELTEKDVTTSNPETSVTETQKEVTEVEKTQDALTKVTESSTTESQKEITEATGTQEITTSVPKILEIEPEKEVTEAPVLHDIVTDTAHTSLLETDHIVTETPESQDVVTDLPKLPTEEPHKEMTETIELDDRTTNIPVSFETSSHSGDSELPMVQDITTSMPEITSTETQKELTKLPEKQGSDVSIADTPATELQKETTKKPDLQDTVTEITEMLATEKQKDVTEIPDTQDSVTSLPKESVTEPQEEEASKLPDKLDTVTKVPDISATESQKGSTETSQDTATIIPDIVTESQSVTEVPVVQETATQVPDTSVSDLQTDVTEVPEAEDVTTNIAVSETDTKLQVTELPEPHETATNKPDITEIVPNKESTEAPEIQDNSVTEISAQETHTEATIAPEADGAATDFPKISVTESQKEVTDGSQAEDITTNILESELQKQETKSPEIQDAVTSVPKLAITESPSDKVTEIPESQKEATESSDLPEVATNASEIPVTESHKEVTEDQKMVTKAPERTQTDADEKEEPFVTEIDESITKAPLETTTKLIEHSELPKVEPDLALHEDDEQTTMTNVFVTESQDKTSDITDKPTTGTENDRNAIKDEENLATKSPNEEPTKTSEHIEPEISDVTTESLPDSVESSTKTPQDSDFESETTKVSNLDVTDKQEYITDSPDVSRRTEVTASPSVEQEDTATKSSEQIEPLDKATQTSEEQEPTSKSDHDVGSTTPYLVLLDEHTHKKDIYTMTPGEEVTTEPSVYEPSTPEVSSIETVKPSLEEAAPTDKEHSVPVTFTVTEPAVVSEEITTASSIPGLPDTQDVHATGQPQDEESNEISTSAPTPGEEQNATEHPLISSNDVEHTTKEVPLTTEKSRETTAPEEEFILATTKATTVKTDDELTTLSPLLDKFGKPEESPSPKPEKPEPDTTQEIPKPSLNEVQTTEEAPQPDDDSHFPPTGTNTYGQEPDYGEEDQAFGPGTCRYGGKVYVSAQQIPRDDPCDFCFCFRSDIICLQQSCPPPIHGCHEEPIQGFCCPRYECPVSMATTLNVTTTTTTTTTTLPPHFLHHAYKGAAERRGCQIKGHTYKVGEVVRASSGPCLHCTCGGDGQMKCDPKVCTPEPMLRQMIAAAVSAKRRR